MTRGITFRKTRQFATGTFEVYYNGHKIGRIVKRKGWWHIAPATGFAYASQADAAEALLANSVNSYGAAK